MDSFSVDNNQQIQVLVKSLKGGTNIINIDFNAKVSVLKKEIAKIDKIPESQQRLVCGNKTLMTVKRGKEQTIQDYNIQNNSQITMIQRLKGGEPSSP